MEVRRLFDLLAWTKYVYPRKIVFAGKEDEQWYYIDSDQYYEESYYLAYGLVNIGVKPGDKIISISFNMPRWNILDMAIMLCGAIHVPVYPTLNNSDFEYIFKHSEAKYIFVSGIELFEKISKLIQNTPNILEVFTIRKYTDCRSMNDLIEIGKNNNHADYINKINENIKSDDIATIIYTSGTTGLPKGVMLSHGNLLSNVYDTSKIPPEHIKRVLSFLPMCHVYERMMNYMYQYRGFEIYYVDNLGKISEMLSEVKPHMITTVPRLLENIFDKVMAKGRTLKFPKKQIFNWAVKLGLKYELKNRTWWYNVRLWIARALVFKKWKKALGGELDIIVSGGAALQIRLSRIFWAAGFRVMEGYGLTETSPVIAVSNFGPNGIKFGTVGPPLPSVEVRIAEDGEILTRGPHVTKGYFKDPELTAQAFTDDGWFRTGDIGILEPEGQLRITDRKKEIFKNSAGKYIAPQLIENTLKESPFIEQVAIFGENQKIVVALIVPNFQNLQSWCASKGLSYTSDQEIIKKQEVIRLFQNEIKRLNSRFNDWERVARFELLSEPWTIESGELTPTLKLRRNVIAEKQEEILKKLFR